MTECINIFISYSKKDTYKALQLYDRLIQPGFNPWIDEKKLLPGQDWKLEIAKNLKKAHVVLICLSDVATSKAGYLQKEIREALDIADQQPEGSIFIIPIKFDECIVPQRLQIWHWVALNQKGGFEKLIKALKYRLSKIHVRSSSITIYGKIIPDPKVAFDPEMFSHKNLEGNYIVRGKNNDGTLYKGRATIDLNNGVYIIKWQIGRDTFSGKGFLKEDILNVFGKVSVSYIISEDGSLTGIWGESGTEKLIPENYFIDDCT